MPPPPPDFGAAFPVLPFVAALPVPDKRLGEKVCLAVMLRTGATVTPHEILAHLDRCGLSRYDMPEYFLKLDEIPLTASGKILKRDIASQIAGGEVVPASIRFMPAKKAASS